MRRPTDKPMQVPLAAANNPFALLDVPPEPTFSLRPEASAPSSPISSVPDAHSAHPSTWTEPAASPEDLYELGLTFAAMSYHTAAIEVLHNCTAIAPNHGAAWQKLAELFRLAGEDAQAVAAEAAARACAGVKWKKNLDERSLPHLHKAESELVEPLKDMPEDEAATAIREHLMANPLDAVAMRFLARLEKRAGDHFAARALFERALDICPDYTSAREEYCQFLVGQHDCAAIVETERLLADWPENPRYRFLRATALMSGGKVDEAIAIVTELLGRDTNNVDLWLFYGNALRVTGRREEAVQAYRKCLDVQPGMGAAWWGLAELKEKVLTPNDVAKMRAQLEEHALPSEHRKAMFYALGQTLERAGDFAASFAAYEGGAREHWAIKELEVKTHPDAAARENSEPLEDSLTNLQLLKKIFSRENLGSRLVPAPVISTDRPIFVVGMPRAGSTLLEQILSSHSQVEGIGERSLIGDIKRDLVRSRLLVTPNAYPDCMLELTQDELAALGARVIAASQSYRATNRPCFVDKRPWNWVDVGLIHMILPQAKIIDIRREPMAACFAMYKQMLPKESCDFSYDFKKLGPYYNRYVDLMDHWHTVLPGRVHFVRYERLVEDTEGEIRRILDYCELPFEEDCLRFWELERAIVTPSAEQVRRPIYRHAMEQWRNFEPWLGPLKNALAAPIET